MSVPLLLLHPYGDLAGGEPWRDALRAWPGPSLAPDLPGHGRAPAPPGGFHEPADVALPAVAALLDAGWTEPPVVVGVAGSAYGAEILALGGRAARLVIVDGLAAAWPTDPDDTMAREAAWIRALADDPAAAGPAPEGPDARAHHGLSPRADRDFTMTMRAAITVPVAVLETPASVTPPAEVDERAAMFGGPTTVTHLVGGDPVSVLAAVIAWVDG